MTATTHRGVTYDEQTTQAQPVQLYSVAKAAELGSWSQDYVRKAIARGELKAERYGGNVRIALPDYLDWLDYLRTEGQKNNAVRV